MIRDITIGQYYPADSVIHKLDPRTKLVGTIGILVLRKENKQNSDMTWQRYKLNLRNSLLLEEYFLSQLFSVVYHDFFCLFCSCH